MYRHLSVVNRSAMDQMNTTFREYAYCPQYRQIKANEGIDAAFGRRTDE